MQYYDKDEVNELLDEIVADLLALADEHLDDSGDSEDAYRYAAWIVRDYKL